MKTLLLSVLLVLSVFAIAQEEIHENILENKTYMDRSLYFKQDPLVNGQIVFLGNSLTQAGSWTKYFPVQNPANRGIAGDNTLGMLGRLSEIIQAKPEKLFIMAGINDISLGRSTDKIMTNIKAIIYQVQEGSPHTQIYVQSLLPINNDNNRYKRMLKKEKQIEKLHKALQKFCEKENIPFLNIHNAFLSENRKLDPKYTTDGLHLNNEGYEVWVNQIRKYVE